MLVDSHTHLYSEKFAADRDEVVQRALEKDVTRFYLPNIDHTSIEGMLALEEQYPEHCFAMMGLHPCNVGADFEKELYEVEAWLNRRPFVAVGEIGTDLYWDETYRNQQAEAFRIQVELAKTHNLPIVIHSRESFAWTVALLEPLQDERLRGIFHCFTGSVDEARRAIDLGFMLGIGGVATFKNGGLEPVLSEIGLEHLVLETDSPYLAPVPHRGKRNEPAFVPLVAQRIADLKQTSLEAVAKATTENALRLFVHAT
ncbi:TatD family hydrolase [Catalinimonas alkaloidigena]|uniref:TatD family hydrolase n=1 Tax=Catalinimonas alkaloidigena TaxID=1075417 RepID=UPI000B2D63ED|nr:TatD family hydrolase [Catalinimonas alkaloidigena]